MVIPCSAMFPNKKEEKLPRPGIYSSSEYHTLYPSTCITALGSPPSTERHASVYFTVELLPRVSLQIAHMAERLSGWGTTVYLSRF